MTEDTIIEERAVDIIDRYMESVVSAVESGVETYGPAVVDAGLWIVRIDNIQSLFWGFFFLILTGVLWTISRMSWKKIKGYLEENPRDCYGRKNDITDTPYFWVSIVTFVGGFLMSFPGLEKTLSIWTWIGVFYPELFLAKLALVKVLN